MRHENLLSNGQSAENIIGHGASNINVGKKIARRKKTVISLFIVMAIAANAIVFNLQTRQAQAAGSITVKLDGNTLSFTDVEPQIIKDRTMLPFRAIGEAMGAEVDWDDATRKVTMRLLDKYVMMYIGNDTMSYGIFSKVNGVINLDTSNIYELDAPAMIVNNRTLVPVRAISEGLGGTVGWDPISLTVSLTSPYNQQSPTPTQDPVFSDTTWFTHITAAEAQEKYLNYEQFVLYMYYESAWKVTKTNIENIKAAARDAGIRVYAINLAAAGYDQDDIPFVRNKVSPEPPFILLINGSDNISILREYSRDSLDYNFTRFANRIVSGVIPVPPTPKPTSNTSKATPTPTPDDRLIHITREAAEDKMNGHDKFVYVYYNSGASNSTSQMNIIKNAAMAAGVDIYASDTKRYDYSDSDQWWGAIGSDMKFPTVFFIEDTMIIEKLEQPSDATKLAQSINQFLWD